MEKVIIFGVLDTAQLAHFYLKHDSDYEVEDSAFVDASAEFTNQDSVLSIPKGAFTDQGLFKVKPQDEVDSINAGSDNEASTNADSDDEDQYMSFEDTDTDSPSEGSGSQRSDEENANSLMSASSSYSQ